MNVTRHVRLRANYYFISKEGFLIHPIKQVFQDNANVLSLQSLNIIWSSTLLSIESKSSHAPLPRQAKQLSSQGMSRELSLMIQFSRSLSSQEQDSFWDELVTWLEQHSLRAGGGQYPDKLDWVIDCSHTTLSPDEVVRLLKIFLGEKPTLIATYYIAPLQNQ